MQQLTNYYEPMFNWPFDSGVAALQSPVRCAELSSFHESVSAAIHKHRGAKPGVPTCWFGIASNQSLSS